jgi:hypothetical protein
LIAHRPQVGQAVAAIGQHHRQVPDHPAGVKELVVEPLEAALALAPDLRLERALPVARCLIGTGPWSVVSVFGVEPLRVFPVPPGGS